MNLLNVTVSTEMRCVNLYIYESLKPTDFNSLCMEPFKFYEYQKQNFRRFEVIGLTVTNSEVTIYIVYKFSLKRFFKKLFKKEL